jgi:hypothetical protein
MSINDGQQPFQGGKERDDDLQGKGGVAAIAGGD